VNFQKGLQPSRKTLNWLRLAALLLGVLLLLWLPVEDTDEVHVLVASAAVSAWLALRYLVSLPGPAKRLGRHILVGTLAGLAVTPLALFLMAFKTGLHGHESPDFTAEQIYFVIYRTPIWGFAGLLLGLGSGMLHLAAPDS
jgi:hypothetical protein